MNLYITRDGQTLGPYTDFQAQEYLKAGVFTPDELACAEGGETWKPLQHYFPSQASRMPPSSLAVR